jgi:mRNA interferase MazF
MRAVHWVQLDKKRPALVLTRPEALRYLHRVTVAPITSTIRGIATEVPVGPEHGLDHDCVVSCDNLTTIHRERLGEHIGWLSDAEDAVLLGAIQAAFALLPPGF